jgi:hypothetical protein
MTRRGWASVESVGVLRVVWSVECRVWRVRISRSACALPCRLGFLQEAAVHMQAEERVQRVQRAGFCPLVGGQVGGWHTVATRASERFCTRLRV